jgi:V/A-type H+/Na+-transporting ATPase subunit E
MSDVQSVKISSLDSKIKDISDYLKSSVLEPAEQEKETIITQAQKDAAKIIEDAKKEAEEIVAKAKKEADALKQNTESALKIAAKQSIDKLKMALEKEILSFGVTEPVKNALKSEEVIKELVSDVLKHYSDKGAFAIVLSDELKKTLSSYINEQINSKGVTEIELSEETIPSGFAVVSSDGVLKYDFSEDSVVELLTEFIRPELRKALFSK